MDLENLHNKKACNLLQASCLVCGMDGTVTISLNVLYSGIYASQNSIVTEKVTDKI
jgi:hypothetical protein